MVGYTQVWCTNKNDLSLSHGKLSAGASFHCSWQLLGMAEETVCDTVEGVEDGMTAMILPADVPAQL